MAVVARRFDVYLATLNPTVGHEIQKTRPCVVVSPDEMNQAIRTVIIAPMTTKGRDYPTRIPVKFQDKSGQIVIDQIRAIDQQRLLKRLGTIDTDTQLKVLEILQEMFTL